MMRAGTSRSANMQKRVAAIPCLYDLEVRLRVMDRFDGYRQVLTLASPPVEALGEPALTRDLGALGVQIFTNVNGLPLDDPRFAPLFASLAALDRVIWEHPAR